MDKHKFLSSRNTTENSNNNTKNKVKPRKRKKGFSLIELVVVIAILAIIAALIVPVLINYVEESRSQKDESTMDEVVNAIQLAIADPDCYDEMRQYAFDNNFITYSDSSGDYDKQVIDGEFWSPDGSGRAVTITMNPERAPNGDTVYYLDKAIVNDMTYGNGSITNDRSVEGARVDNVQCYFKDAKLSPNQPSGYTYNKVRQIVGDKIVNTSYTYANSSYTIFIRFSTGLADDGMKITQVYGSFNGTNLYDGAPASQGTGTSRYDDGITSGEKVPIKVQNGGTTNANFSGSALTGAGATGGSYKQDTDNKINANGVLSFNELGEFMAANPHIKKVIFSSNGLKEGEDVSAEQNGSVLAQITGDTMTVSTTKSNARIQVPNDCQGAFSGYRSQTWFTVEYVDVSGISTGNVTKMNEMFYTVGENSETIEIVGFEYWNTANVTTMQGMFRTCGQNSLTIKLSGLEHFNTSKCKSFERMFYAFGQKATSISTIDMSKWNTSNVTTLNALFMQCSRKISKFNFVGFEKWDVSKCTTFKSCFYQTASAATSFEIDLSKWDVSSAEDMSSMFYALAPNATPFKLGDLSGWDVSHVKNFHSTFSHLGNNLNSFGVDNIGDVGKWDVSSCENFGYMFSSIMNTVQGESFVLDLSNWDTSSAISMEGMFIYNSTNVKKASLGDLSGWNVSNVTNMQDMFRAFGRSATSLYIGDLSPWNTEKVENMYCMFDGFGVPVKYSMDLSGWNVSNVTNHEYFADPQYASKNIINPVWVN